MSSVSVSEGDIHDAAAITGGRPGERLMQLLGMPIGDDNIAQARRFMCSTPCWKPTPAST